MMNSRPSRLVNVVANYVGVASSLVVGVALVPVYVRLLGSESYGIIGFFTTLYSVLQVMDLGLGMAVNRELARRQANAHDGQSTANLIRTVEILSWGLGLLLGSAVWMVSDFLAAHWLVAQALPHEAIRRSIALMGLTIALQWPSSIYSGGLMGLERQVQSVSVTTSSNIVFALGAIGLLAWSPSVVTFFYWRAAISACTTLILRALLWKHLPGVTRCTRSTFELASLSTIWRFSLGMAGVSLTGIALLQLDKVIVSRVLTLDRFGAYMVASTAAGVIPQFVAPIFSAFLPALSSAVARADREGIRTQFHASSQLISMVVFPIACAVTLFAEPLLLVWTKDAGVAANGAPVLSLLAAGALLNSVMVPFYAVQVASGWTKVATMTNLVLIAIVIPYSYMAAERWGAPGAASTWLVLNAVYIGIGSTLTLRRLLVGEVAKWITLDVMRPLAISVLIMAVSRWLFPRLGGLAQTLSVVSVSTLLTMGTVVLTAPQLRRKAGVLLARLRVP